MARRLSEAERRPAMIEAAFRVARAHTLAGVSARAVAEEAGVSKALVFFYFRDKHTLLLELLDWLLESTLVLRPLDPAPGATPRDRLFALVSREVRNLTRQHARTELFLDYWVMGQREPEIRRRIRGAFDRYRAGFLPYARARVAEGPERFGRAGAEGLASLAVSFIQGCALQLITDPEGFDVDRYLEALEGLVRS